jgi:hypothetical protein
VSMSDTPKRYFRVEALEQFLMKTTYYAAAYSPEQAEAIAASGRIAYEHSESADGDDAWVETLKVVEIGKDEVPEYADTGDYLDEEDG